MRVTAKCVGRRYRGAYAGECVQPLDLTPELEKQYRRGVFYSQGSLYLNGWRYAKVCACVRSCVRSTNNPNRWGVGRKLNHKPDILA